MATHIYHASVFRRGAWHSAGFSIRSTSAAKARANYLRAHPSVKPASLRMQRSTSPLSRKENPSRKAKSRRVANPSKPRASMDAFTRAYVEAALWSSTDDDGTPLDRNYSVKDILGATLTQMKRDCASFQRENRHDLAEGTASQGGHDFWLTRNREGAGYWDGDWPEPAASDLTKSAHHYGPFDLYVYRGKVRH